MRRNRTLVRIQEVCAHMCEYRETPAYRLDPRTDCQSRSAMVSGISVLSSRRERAMSGGDATSLLARLPDRLSHVVHDWAIRDPYRAALRSGLVGLSYGALWDATCDAISHLQRLGIRAGDRVALVAENGLQVVPLILALSELDAWAVP